MKTIRTMMCWAIFVPVFGLLISACSSDDDGEDASSSSSSGVAGSSSSSSSSSSASSSSSGGALLGAELYQAYDCADCHGSLGDGGSSGVRIILDNWSLQTLTDRIRETMPLGSPGRCGQQCAESIASHMLSWQTEKICGSEETLLPRRLRLLTPHEYQLTIIDLFGLSKNNSYTNILPRTEPIRGYDNNVPEIQVTYAHATQYWNLAQKLSETVRLSRVADCDSLTQQECSTEMLNTFGARIFRRPLNDDEKAIYSSLFVSEISNELGMRQVLKSMLMSPSFLYRSELGESDGNGGFRLTSYEVASLLSYTFTGTMPDEVLISLAANNQLLRTDVIVEQTKRLLESAKAKDQLVYFAEQWLDVTDLDVIFRSPQAFPEFDWSMGQAMKKELSYFFGDVFLNETSKFRDLYLADFVYANDMLASFYDLSGPSSSAFQKIGAGPQRGGILNLGALLAVHAKMDQTSPIARGVFVRERLLCQEFPPPPPNAGGVIPLNPNLSARVRFSAHTDNDGCRSCHEKIDPIGFSFERYDGSGHYREVEGNDLAVDDSGSLSGLKLMSDTDDQPYTGTHGLSKILADASSTAYCFADQFHTYLQGVKHPDSCTVENVVSRWSQKEYTLYDLWIESVKSPSFISRQ